MILPLQGETGMLRVCGVTSIYLECAWKKLKQNLRLLDVASGITVCDVMLSWTKSGVLEILTLMVDFVI